MGDVRKGLSPIEPATRVKLPRLPRLRLVVPGVAAVARARLELLRRDYAETENVLFAWEALAACRRSRVPLPPWALDALAEGAEALLALALDGTTPDWHRVASALGLRRQRGKSSSFAAFERWGREYRMALDVEQELARGKPRHVAVKRVATSRGASQRVVERAYDRLRQALDEPL